MSHRDHQFEDEEYMKYASLRIVGIMSAAELDALQAIATNMVLRDPRGKPQPCVDCGKLPVTGYWARCDSCGAPVCDRCAIQAHDGHYCYGCTFRPGEVHHG